MLHKSDSNTKLTARYKHRKLRSDCLQSLRNIPSLEIVIIYNNE